jgi:phosphate uptake regulator
MEIRRVQLTGGSSYIITLPKEWINSVHIKKNDPLGMHIQSDGTLLITPKITQEYKRIRRQSYPQTSVSSSIINWCLYLRIHLS